MTFAYEFFRLAAAIVATLAACTVLIACAQWVALQRRKVADYEKQAAERDRQLALQAAQWNRFVIWQMREKAMVGAPRSSVQVVGANDDRPEPLSRRGADLMSDEELLSDPVHAPITIRSEEMGGRR